MATVPSPPPPASVRPGVPVTWPMVAYAFVRELPYTLMVIAGAVVAMTFVIRSSASALEPLLAVIAPAVVSALGRSRPAEHEMGRNLGLMGVGGFAFWLVRKLLGGGALG
jgi:hypothetical protein